MDKFYSKYRKAQQNIRDECEIIVEKKALFLPMFEVGQVTPEYMSAFDHSREICYRKTDCMWNKISAITQIISNVGVILVLLTTTTLNEFLIFIKIYSEFTGTCKSITSFVSQVQKWNGDLENFEKKWSKLHFTEPIPQHILPTEFTVTELCRNTDSLITGNPYNPNFDHKTLNTLQIQKGDKIVVIGNSGCGKTTFVNKLLGKRAGAIFSIHNKNNISYELVPANYTDCFIVNPQNSNEIYKTNKITIRQLFSDEKDNTLIMECLDDCCLDKWLKRFEKTTECKECTVLDIPINNKVSGGEKRRLITAMVICKCRKLYSKSRSHIIFFGDEIDDGTDTDQGIDMYTRICKRLCDITMILVTHNKETVVHLDWTHIIKVNEGVVSLL